MEALKLEVAVGADRRIVIELPAEAEGGRAEVIVLWSPVRAVVDFVPLGWTGHRARIDPRGAFGVS